MAYYSTYNFPTHKQGDTFLGVEFHLTDGNDDPIDLEGTLIELITSTPHEETLSSATGGITILDESEDSSGERGLFMVDEQIIDWAPGNYSYELIFTFPSGKKRTYVVGKWVITK